MVNHKTYGKSIFREIKKSAGRFIAIAAIVALGVGFLVGLLSSTPDMKDSIDKYYDENNMTDIFVKSTMGLTRNDIDAIRNFDGVKDVTSACVTDIILNAGEYSLTGRIYGMDLNNPDELVNKLALVDGRFPEKAGECVVQHELGEMKEFPIGTKITFSEFNEDFDDLDEIYAVEEFTVVGVVRSPFYFGYEREPSFVGNGRLETVIYTPRDSYSLDFETDVYLTLEKAGATGTFTDEYEDIVEGVVEKLEDLGAERSKIRYGEVKDEAAEKLSDAKYEYKTKKTDAENKLADAWQEILDGKQELTDAELDIKEAEKEIEDGEKELADGKNKIVESPEKFAEAEKKIADAEKEIADGEKEIEDGKKEIEENRAKLEEGLLKVQHAEETLDSNYRKLEVLRVKVYELRRKEAQGTPLTPEETALIQQYESGMQQYRYGRNQVTKKHGIIIQGFTELEQAEKDIEKAEKDLVQGKIELEDAKKELADGKLEIEDAKKDVEDAEKKLVDGKKELEDGKKEIADNKKKLEDGEKEYFEEKAKAEKEFEDAEKKIAKAEEDIKNIEQPEWFVLDRNSNATFASYKVNVEKVSDVAKVFPVFFFLVAALVSLTTMTRMVEEERTQIGTLKALGYSKSAIMAKYLLYCGLATVLGCVSGVLIGYRMLPVALNNAYTTLYDLPPFYTKFYWKYTLFACTLEILCTMGATWAAAYYALNEKPAFLMRPKAPKAGRRIWIEHITFLWKRLSFSYKATCRNVFRNKGHLFMTVIGISGCTALMFAGFGMKDSIGNVAHEQFENIWKYDLTMTLEDEADTEAVKNIIENYPSIPVYQEVGKIKDDNNSITATIFVPENNKKIEDFIKFQNRKSKEFFHLNNDGVLLTEKAAQTLSAKKGDIINIENAEGKKAKIKVNGIVENYAGTFIYMTEDVFNKSWGKLPEYDDYLISSGITESENKDKTVEELLACDEVASVSFTSDMRRTYDNLLYSINYIVIILTVAAGGLAVIVLYNLTNINIHERTRELATLRVLGYHHIEVAGYIYREITILSVLGTLLGLFLGTALERYVVYTAETTEIMFGRTITPWSYIIAAVATLVFSAIVDFMMSFKLRRIEMVESMKAVD